jgi:bbp21
MRKHVMRRWSVLRSERSGWVGHWREISEHVIPRNGRFVASERNRGGRNYNRIYDNTPTRALDVLSAGLMSGLTSPSRPWFKLATPDDALNSMHSVKVWLSQVERMMLTVFQRSNVYGALHSAYEELGAFGTAAVLVLPDFENVVRCFPLTAGEYAVAVNWRGEVDTLYREFDKSVGELVGEFGLEACSSRVQEMYRKGQYDEWVTVIHAIEPRRKRDGEKRDALNMPFVSVYLEAGAEAEGVLRESGFRHFPALVPRWAVSGGDIYGHSPAMKALGDIKQLQHEQLRKSSAIDYQTNPPLVVPSQMKGRDDYLPGGVSYYDGAAAVQTAFNVNLDIRALLDDIGDVRGRINSAFYADLFLMISAQNQPNMTATEVAERHEEKMLMLGPVLERLQNELIDPLITLAFEAMNEAGILPPPPEELQGAQLSVVLLSILAQAQRAVGANSIDRYVATMASVAQVKPEVLDNFNADAWAEYYADALGVDPSLTLPQKQVAAIREQRAQQQQAAQQAEMARQGADIAQTLAQAQALGS